MSTAGAAGRAGVIADDGTNVAPEETEEAGVGAPVVELPEVAHAAANSINAAADATRQL